MVCQLLKVRLDPEMDSFSVMVQGATLGSTTPLRIIRAACKNLGLSSNGSKMKCLKRLHQHIQAQELLAQQGAILLRWRMRFRGSL